MSSTAALSPAKINLLLKVLKKREDGYHDLYTVMQPVALFDKISIDSGDGDGISLECGQADIPAGSSNLAFKAAELFLKKTGLKKRVSIVIEKNIPVGAGLGGGSSNAATVLMSLNKMLGAGLGAQELKEMAARLGSDVPFFIMKGPAIATGRGEVLRRVNLPSVHYVLINPGFAVSTGWVYGNLDLTNKGEDNILFYSNMSFDNPEGLAALLSNDLEEVTCRKYPEISILKQALVECGAMGALMSGSGPTVFGVFSDNAAALHAFNALEKRFAGRGFSIFLARGL